MERGASVKPGDMISCVMPSDGNLNETWVYENAGQDRGALVARLSVKDIGLVLATKLVRRDVGMNDDCQGNTRVEVGVHDEYVLVLTKFQIGWVRSWGTRKVER